MITESFGLEKPPETLEPNGSPSTAKATTNPCPSATSTTAMLVSHSLSCSQSLPLAFYWKVASIRKSKMENFKRRTISVRSNLGENRVLPLTFTSLTH